MNDPLVWLVIAILGTIGFVGGLFGNWYDGRERRDAERRNRR
jgi:hypothetical protein